MEQINDAVKVLNLRLDEALHRQLTVKARRSVRSLNAKIIFGCEAPLSGIRSAA
jgi:predicted HicB family RNase H-like nuclease